jgi:hypothetical protein
MWIPETGTRTCPSPLETAVVAVKGVEGWEWGRRTEAGERNFLSKRERIRENSSRRCFSFLLIKKKKDFKKKH